MSKKKFKFIDFEDSRIFTCKIEPKVTNNTAIIMCYPLWHEYLISQRVYFNFAEVLSEQGFTVYLFDYRGFGDSSHSIEESNPSSIQTDILNILEYVSSECKSFKIGLFGVTLGGSFAVLTSIKVSVDFMVLWSPVIDLEKYITFELRKSISSQTSILKKVVYNRNQIKDRLKQDKSLEIKGFLINNIDGYIINKKYITEFEGVNLLNSNNLIDMPVFIADVKLRDTKLNIVYKEFVLAIAKKYPKSETVLCVEKAIPWQDSLIYTTYLEDLFKVSIEWINSICHDR